MLKFLPVLAVLAFLNSAHAGSLDHARELAREIETRLPEETKTLKIIACDNCDNLFEPGEDAVINLERVLTLTAADPELGNMHSVASLGDKLRDNLISALSGEAYESLTPEEGAKLRFCALASPEVNLFSSETFEPYCQSREQPTAPATAPEPEPTPVIPPETPVPAPEAPAPTPEVTP